MTPIRVRVERGEGANDLLALALGLMGCQVSRGTGKGEPTFSADWGGFRLTAWDEEGKLLSPDRLLVLLTRIEMEDGLGRCALPPWAPAAAETVAERYGGQLLRLGRDGSEAEELWRQTPWFRDAVFAACRICQRMARTGESLAQLDRALPAFATVRGEVPLRSGRGRVMGEALRTVPAAQRQGEGARFPVGEGWVYVIPMSSRPSLRLIAESVSMEAAEELRAEAEKTFRELDEQ